MAEPVFEPSEKAHKNVVVLENIAGISRVCITNLYVTAISGYCLSFLEMSVEIILKESLSFKLWEGTQKPFPVDFFAFPLWGSLPRASGWKKWSHSCFPTLEHCSIYWIQNIPVGAKATHLNVHKHTHTQKGKSLAGLWCLKASQYQYFKLYLCLLLQEVFTRWGNAP